MDKLRTVILGSGTMFELVCQMLDNVNYVDIVGIADVGPGAAYKNPHMYPGTLQSKSPEEVVAIPGIDIIIDTSGVIDENTYLGSYISDRTTLVNSKTVELMIYLLREKEELLQIKRMQGELSAILNSVQEAIEVVNKDGIVKYVNPAFTRVTGIPENRRIGQSIYSASPESSLVKVMRTGEMIFGHRTKVGGSNAEVISNAAPIIVDGEMDGAVVVFQHITDIIRLMDELRRSNIIIEDLSQKFGLVTSSKYTFSDILGKNREFNKIVHLAQSAAKATSTVLLLGQSGTGKELFAHAIHHESPRWEKPFIKINCAAIPEQLLESELFGYEKGAFTGAIKSRIGKFELAHGGTIFLDEIGDMDLNMQAKLLRVLQEKEFERIGGNKTISIDARVIAATNRNLRQMIREGRFREDLYFRLNVVEVNIPPLKSRKEDIPLLARHFLAQLNRQLGKRVSGLDHAAEQLLLDYDWPGNVRELANVLERIMVTHESAVIGKKELLQSFKKVELSFSDQDLELMPLEQMERVLIQRALEKFGHSVEGKKKAAQALKISLATLYNKLKKGDLAR